MRRQRGKSGRRMSDLRSRVGGQVSKKSLNMRVDGMGEGGSPCMRKTGMCEGGIVIEVRLQEVVDSGSGASAEKGGTCLQIREANVEAMNVS
jgi:hypothetical protein